MLNAFNFLTAATPHHGIRDTCCFLLQATACAFQKPLAKMTLLLPQARKEHNVANAHVWWSISFWFKRSASREPGVREVSATEKLIQPESNCLQLKTCTCIQWLWKVHRLLGHTKDQPFQPITQLLAMCGSCWVAALPQPSCDQTGLPHPIVRNLILP